MASDVGSILLIVGASLIGIGAMALSATTYSIDDMLTKSNNRAINNTNKKETVESDTEDEDEEEDKEDIMDIVTDLSKKLPNSVSGFNRDQYSLTPEEGWSVSKGGKRSRKRKSRSKKSKSKSRKNKSKK
jgi:hypothetical protein